MWLVLEFYQAETLKQVLAPADMQEINAFQNIQVTTTQIA